MKLTITLSEVRDRIADQHNIPVTAVEIIDDVSRTPIVSGGSASQAYPQKRLIEELKNVIDEAKKSGAQYNKITAIKAARTLVPGWGLKDAKDFIEANIVYLPAVEAFHP